MFQKVKSRTTLTICLLMISFSVFSGRKGNLEMDDTYGINTQGLDLELSKYYVVNETGNLLISSTALESSQITEDVSRVLAKARVFLANLTKALALENKNLKYTDDISKVLDASGMFYEVQRETINIKDSSNETEFKTKLIFDVIGDVAKTATGSMGGTTRILMKVLSSLDTTPAPKKSGGFEYKKTKDFSGKNIGHFIIMCENLLGSPFISAQIFQADYSTYYSESSSPCHHHVVEDNDFTYEKITYSFVDPDDIKKYEQNLVMPEDIESEMVYRMQQWIKESSDSKAKSDDSKAKSDDSKAKSKSETETHHSDK